MRFCSSIHGYFFIRFYRSCHFSGHVLLHTNIVRLVLNIKKKLNFNFIELNLRFSFFIQCNGIGRLILLTKYLQDILSCEKLITKTENAHRNEKLIGNSRQRNASTDKKICDPISTFL